MIISMKEEQKTLEYNDIIKLDVKNIAKIRTKTIWRLIYEVIHAPVFEVTNFSTRIFRQM